MNCIDSVAREDRLIAAEGIHCLKRKHTALCRILCRSDQISCSVELQVFHNYLLLTLTKNARHYFERLLALFVFN